VGVVKGQTQQLVAKAMYSDGTSAPVTNSVTWTPVDTNTATVSPSGLLSGVEVGSTTLTATKDGVTSNTVSVTVCKDLAGKCIDIFDAGGGKLFTNSPSVDYLSSFFSSQPSAFGATYSENGTYGPSGNFYKFYWNTALCGVYSIQSLGGRTNWRTATKDELKMELFDTFGNMFTARGWPTGNAYWSSTPDGSNGSNYYYDIILYSGVIFSHDAIGKLYMSCVSNP
ncbi:hypothetical protein COR24_19205, partial [Vibrio cholerae]|nr:hypothetical protein [Vibrio cholerae]EGR5464536.1 hypothetical protein [Vibrio cholerae]